MKWPVIEKVAKKAEKFLEAKYRLGYALEHGGASLATGCKESADLRRASMCLTRMLAEMRKT